MQYLGGYVLHKLHTKLKSSKSWDSHDHQQAPSILEAARGNNITRNLVSALSRGGLWDLSTSSQKLMLLTEKYFRLKTGNVKDQKIYRQNCRRTYELFICQRILQ